MSPGKTKIYRTDSVTNCGGEGPTRRRTRGYSTVGTDCSIFSTLGDFSKRIVDTAVGTTAFLEGPYGLFIFDDDSPGAIFIMGGIGITPAMSILRSVRDRGDRRPMLLIYGNSTWDEVVFRSELESLQEEISLRVVHVLAEADEEWQGETGYINDEILQRHIGAQQRDYSVFVCGPEPMMDVVEKALLELHFPLHQIRAERFDIA